MSLGYAHLNVVEALPVSRFAPEGAEHVCRRLRGQRFTALEVPTYDVKIEGTALRGSFSASTKMAYGCSMIHWRQSGRISKMTVRRTPVGRLR